MARSTAARATGAAHVAAACWFAALAAAMSWPLVLHLGTHVPGRGAGDNVAFLWNFWWARHALTDPAASLFSTGHLFAPFGTSLVLHTHTALESVAGATALAAVPLVTAHNLVLLTGLAANGLATYGLASHYAQRSLAAVLAGTIFAASAFISIRLLGHFNLAHAWVLPLALLAWVRCLERPSMGRGAAAGLAFAAAALTDYYYALYAVVAAILFWALEGRRFRIVSKSRPSGALAILLSAAIGALLVLTGAILATGGFQVAVGSVRVSATSVRNPLAALWLLVMLWLALRVRVHAPRDGGAERRPVVAATGMALGVCLVALLPLALAAGRLLASGDYVPPPQVWRSGPRGVDVITVIAGNPLNPISGGVTREVYSRMNIDLMEQTAWIGIVPLVILAIGLARGALGDPLPHRWWMLTVGFLIWAIGGYVVAAGVDTGLPMPQLLTRFLPIVSNARIPGRAMAMVQLGAAVLCAIAAARLDWPRLALGGLIAVSVADGIAAPIPLYEIPSGRVVESALAASGPAGTVVELPAGLRDGFGENGRFDHRALVFQTYHGRPIAGGFVARLPSRIKTACLAVPALAALIDLSSSGDPRAPDTLPGNLASGLLDAGITHVVVNTDTLPFSLRGALESRGLKLLVVDGQRELYVVGGSL